MRNALARLFNDKDADLGSKLVGIYAVLVIANVLAWVLALVDAVNVSTSLFGPKAIAVPWLPAMVPVSMTVSTPA